MAPLDAWHDFYVIVGSSAGALIGLQFVVITLIASLPIRDKGAQGSAAFATPTVVHFGTVLLLAAVLTAPWPHMAVAPVIWGLVGVVGVVYAAVVIRRMRTQTAYRPEFEDWLCHAVLPLLAYATLLASSLFFLGQRGLRVLFAVAAAALLLLFVGIHNAWDAITYHVFFSRKKSTGEDRGSQNSSTATP